jgi:hypothetical protein
MNNANMWNAHYHAQQAANDLLVAHTIRGETGRVSSIYTETALHHAEKFAAALGYKLVEAPPVAAEAPAVEEAA